MEFFVVWEAWTNGNYLDDSERVVDNEIKLGLSELGGQDVALGSKLVNALFLNFYTTQNASNFSQYK